MFNIKNTISIVAIMCGLLIVFAAPKQASAQFMPPGSYKETCKQIYTKGTTLYASCNPKDKSVAAPSSKLVNYFECDGSIWNDDANLKCNRNTDSALMQKARSAINASYKNVFGYEPSDYSVQKAFLKLLFEEGYEQQFYDGKLGGLANLGLLDFFQTWLSKPENAKAKQSVIERALEEVHGFAYPNRTALYVSSKTGFRTIVLAEQKSLNADTGLRIYAIDRAYTQTMGRMSDITESDYWRNKQEYYSQIVAANRAFLYSPNGATELRETVKRALTAKSKETGRPMIIFSDEFVDAAVTKYTEQKAIYKEMMGWK